MTSGAEHNSGALVLGLGDKVLGLAKVRLESDSLDEEKRKIRWNLLCEFTFSTHKRIHFR